MSNLPMLPSDLEILHLFNLVQLEPLPELPGGILDLDLIALPQIKTLPTMPDSLVHLYIGYLPLLECLPELPSTLQLLSVFDSGVHCAPNLPSGIISNMPLCGFYNAGICPFFSPSISGHVFHDLNTNGTRDPGEVGFGQATVQFAPGNTITGVMNSGFYAQALDSGTYAITPNVSNPYVLSISPTSHSASLVNINDVDSLNDFAVQLQPNVQDLTTDLAFLSHARPGFNNMVHLSYRNEGTITMSGTVVFHFDDDQSWNSSTPAPDMISGNTATWNFTDLELGEQRQIFISLHTDASVILGTAIDHDAVAEPVNTDQTPADNVAFLSGEVVGAFDPNDISVLPSELTSAQVAAGELLTYTIRFQNTGTYLAERVIITDTLSSDLVWSSVEFIASSHPCSWYIHDGTLRVTFDQIMLPDSTSNEPDSHGFVRFSLAPDPGLLNGAQFGSTANIYFDYNPPVITNEAIFLVNDPTQVGDLARPDLSIRPNPVEDLLILEKTTSGTSLLEVLDLTGRVVIRTTFPGSMRTLDVRSLNSGSYLIRIDGRPMGRFVRR
ncbi:MAG: T9SS type A sorting domain-containing protein [Flavobacteriales bacterium]|nr:T9SS type A sorting domain-containing protein [Flavobacteriales bacterium]